jgi:RimJ/RimL family protein N-acetyltransferase
LVELGLGTRLVRLGEEHLDATLGWLSDPALRRQIDSLGQPTAATNAAYWRAQWADPRREDYAILHAAGRHVGNCGLTGIDRSRRKAELWIYLGDSAARGAGSGASAVRLLLRRAFDELELNRVYLRVLANNPAAERFYRRLGFVAEGRWRADTWQDGRPVDALWFSMLADEYRAQATREPGS